MQLDLKTGKFVKIPSENDILGSLQKLNTQELKTLYRNLKKGVKSLHLGKYEFYGFLHWRLSDVKKQYRLSLIKSLFLFFNGKVFNEGYEVLPAMPYDEWKKTNLGYEMLIERCYQKTNNFPILSGEYYASISRCINAITQLKQ